MSKTFLKQKAFNTALKCISILSRIKFENEHDAYFDQSLNLLSGVIKYQINFLFATKVSIIVYILHYSIHLEFDFQRK